MEGRKLRRQKVDKKEKQEKQEKQEKSTNKNINVLVLISKVLVILLTVVLVAVSGIVIYLKVLPNKYLIPLCILLVAICGAGIFLVFRKKTSKRLKIILSAISVVLIGIFTFVGLKLVKTLDFLDDMTTETVNAKTYSVVVLKDSKYTKLEDLQYRLLLYYDNELNQSQGAIDKLTGVMTVVTEKTDDVHELANRLIKNEVDAILIEDSYYAIIEEEMEDFKEKTKVVYTFALEDVIETIAKEVSVTKEPFVIYVSGIDSYGKISSVARSDVNMLVVVNPQTKQILLVNTPRDYYVKLHGTSGYRDKLTHAGIYGIDMSVKTMEDLYGVDINYYVRVNFTSLINIIDAIGGVNVYSEYTFTSRIGKYKFKKGYNQMNGKQALGFARERYSFSNGDRMRGQNQQAVINAMIEKVCSSKTILTKFDALLDSLKGSFQTNMEYTKMLDIVRMQISDGASWNISSISVDGAGSSERTYSMGKTRLSVLIPYAGSVNKAEALIDDVLEGKMLEKGAIDISSYNDYLVVSRGVYEDEKKPEKEPEQETPETGDEETGETPNEGTQGGDNVGGEGDNNTENTPDENEGNTGDGTGTTTPEQGNDGENTENEGGNTSNPGTDSGNDSAGNDSGNSGSGNNDASGDNSGTTQPPSQDTSGSVNDNKPTEETTPSGESTNNTVE